MSRGERFEFGRNWAQFLAVLDEERIHVAERALQQMLAKLRDRTDICSNNWQSRSHRLQHGDAHRFVTRGQREHVRLGARVGGGWPRQRH